MTGPVQDNSEAARGIPQPAPYSASSASPPTSSEEPPRRFAAAHALANRLERSGLTGELARNSDTKRSRVLTQTHVIAA